MSEISDTELVQRMRKAANLAGAYPRISAHDLRLAADRIEANTRPSHKAMREALEPFAAIAKDIGPKYLDNDPCGQPYGYPLILMNRLTYGDFRRAAAALASPSVASAQPERKFARHPLAWEGSTAGALGMKAGDRIVYEIDGRHGRADDFTHDGDAFVVFDDGSYETVKWNHLHKEPSASAQPSNPLPDAANTMKAYRRTTEE